MNLNELMNKKFYAPLPEGVHQVILLEHNVIQREGKDPYLQVKFAPADTPEFVHTVSLFVGSFDQVSIFVSNMLRQFPELAELSAGEILNQCMGRTVPATLERVTKATPSGTNTYLNWYLGYVKTSTSSQNPHPTEEPDL